MNVCEVMNNLLDRKIITKTSASPSVILSGDVNENMSIIAKIFANVPDDKKLGLQVAGMLYEMKVYNFITENIYQKLSPNFIPSIASGFCSQKDISYSVLSRLQNIYGKGDYDIGILFTNNLNSVGEGVNTFPSLFLEVDQEEKEKLIFQVIIALCAMQKFKIRHNDLHLNNILVVILEEEVELNFKILGDFYLVKTRYIPCIFDWDFSYVESLGDNPKLNSADCWEDNMCNVYEPRFDLYTFMCYLYMYLKFEMFPNYQNEIMKERENLFEEENILINLTLTEEEKNKIEIYRTITPFLYKIPISELHNIFGNRLNNKYNFEHIKSLKFSMTENPDGTYTLFPKPGFHCRPETFTENMETPLEMIKYFSKFKIENSEAEFIYEI